MPLQLRVIRGANSGAAYSLDPSQPTVIGRASDCTIHLDDASVSRHHCQIVVDHGRATVEDLGSRWGTVVNGKRLTSIKDIRKWLKRNCKWTLDRECTPQEKGDFLSFIQQQ